MSKWTIRVVNAICHYRNQGECCRLKDFSQTRTVHRSKRKGRFIPNNSHMRWSAGVKSFSRKARASFAMAKLRLSWLRTPQKSSGYQFYWFHPPYLRYANYRPGKSWRAEREGHLEKICRLSERSFFTLSMLISYIHKVSELNVGILTVRAIIFQPRVPCDKNTCSADYANADLSYEDISNTVGARDSSMVFEWRIFTWPAFQEVVQLKKWIRISIQGRFAAPWAETLRNSVLFGRDVHSQNFISIKKQWCCLVWGLGKVLS